MRAKLYLSSLHQDLIDRMRTVEQFKNIGNPQAWVLCCDGFCCILDFNKFQHPAELVAAKRQFMSWHIRREDFGGLLWNPDTNRVFELDHDAFDVLMTLQEGSGVEKAMAEHGLRASELHLLLAQISETQDCAAESESPQGTAKQAKKPEAGGSCDK